MRISRQQIAARRAARTARALQPTPMRADRAMQVVRDHQATVASRPSALEQAVDAIMLECEYGGEAYGAYAPDKTSEQALDFSQYFFSDLALETL